MAIRRITKYGEKILAKKTKRVVFDEIRKDLPGLLADMFETMDAVGGAGLAANQVGLDLRLAVIKIHREDEDPLSIVIINPELVEKSGSMYEDEGCLSFPGLFAKALQHEMDHLDGVTFVDRLPLLTRLKLKPTLLKLKAQWKKIDERRMKPETL